MPAAPGELARGGGPLGAPSAAGGGSGAVGANPGLAPWLAGAADHEARMRRAALLPRVPHTRGARLVLWGLLAVGSGLAGAQALPQAGVWQIGQGARGCELQEPGLGARCACGSWPARLRLLLGAPLELAAASPADLEQFPGIGPGRAAAIARARAERGGLARLEDLAQVPGIGRRAAERLGPYLAFGPAPCPEPDPAGPARAAELAPAGSLAVPAGAR